MFTHRTRKTVLAGVSLVAAGMMVSACGPDGGSSDASGSKDGASSAQSPKESASGGSDSAAPDSGSGGGTENKDGAAGTAAPAGKAPQGTFQGSLTYMAPGKFMVEGGGKRIAFYVQKGAKITGYGTLCGNPGQESSCTESQLEAATKKKAVPGKVTLHNGAASAITERKPGTAGGDADEEAPSPIEGSLRGVVKYLAPQKFTVKAGQSAEQAFYVSNATKISGAGKICGNGDTPEDCTIEQLEAAAKKGVTAEVELKDGSATAVTESHR
ncbi:hypothetical protein [Streptomyces sp. ODS28]|uniref:hypothetical protein n=1 Tax=Streptomyces sp. ODS28 TaxID=3136688 RepID=UPI0031E97FA4